MAKLGRRRRLKLNFAIGSHDVLDAQEKRAVLAQKKLDAAIEKNESARLALVNAITVQSQIQTAIATATGAAKSQLQADLKQQTTLVDQLKPQYIDAKGAGRIARFEVTSRRRQ